MGKDLSSKNKSSLELVFYKQLFSQSSLSFSSSISLCQGKVYIKINLGLFCVIQEFLREMKSQACFTKPLCLLSLHRGEDF